MMIKQLARITVIGIRRSPYLMRRIDRDFGTVILLADKQTALDAWYSTVPSLDMKESDCSDFHSIQSTFAVNSLQLLDITSNLLCAITLILIPHSLSPEIAGIIHHELPQRLQVFNITEYNSKTCFSAISWSKSCVTDAPLQCSGTQAAVVDYQ